MRTVQLESARDRTHEFHDGKWPGHSCCCTAPPVVKVIMPPSGLRDHSVGLFLCGHHYRASLATLALNGVTTSFRDRDLALWWAIQTR